MKKIKIFKPINIKFSESVFYGDWFKTKNKYWIKKIECNYLQKYKK